MPDIVTDISINQNWNARKGANNPVTFTFTQSSAAFDITTYTFSVQLRKFGSSTNLLNLTEGSGVTNNGAAGTLNVVFTSANLTNLVANDYYWQMTVVHPDTFSYLWFQGTFNLFSETYTGDLTSNVTGTIDVNGTTINTAITLGVNGGGALTNGSGTTANGTAVDLGGNISGNTYIYDPTQTLNFRIGQGIGNNPSNILIAAHNYAFFGRRALQYLEFNSGNTTLNLGSDATGDTYTRNAAGYLIRKGITSTASTATLTVDSDNTYLAIVTAQAEAITIANPTGTPFTGQEFSVRLTDNGTSRAITFGNAFVEFETFPTATTLGKRMYLGFVYNGSGWDYMGSRTQL
jgi:hypothetical protein